MRDFTKIEAWRLADDLTVALYEATRSFPRDEIFGLTSQLRRASYSVPSNIAEGSARHSKKDYLPFLYIARGSAAEAQYFIHLAGRLGYFSSAQVAQLTDQSRRSLACLIGLIAAVEKEAGKLSTIVAATTSGLALAIAKLVAARYTS